MIIDAKSLDGHMRKWKVWQKMHCIKKYNTSKCEHAALTQTTWIIVTDFKKQIQTHSVSPPNSQVALSMVSISSTTGRVFLHP